MKEKLDMIPVNDAFMSGDECPFCYLERQAERSAIRYVAGPGASYMEPDVRAATDRTGFCREHTKKLFDYGNALGAALMLQTYYAGVLEEFQAESGHLAQTPKPGLFRKKQTQENSCWTRMRQKVDACYICDKIEYNMQRYYHTFFAMLKDPEFRTRVENCKGFCMRHFSRMLEMAPDRLSAAQWEWLYQVVISLMEDNLIRVKEDLDWLIAKYDYRNAGADWKNSVDALQRAMQKMEGLHPEDPPYKEK